MAGLRSLRERAPASLADGVLRTIGAQDAYAEMDTPLWPLLVAWGPTGISAIERVEDPGAFESEYEARTGRQIRRAASVPDRIARQVRKRMRGESVAGLRVDLSGLNEFQRRVLAKTMEIPHGEVRPYAWVAEEIGYPRAQRAVGTALAQNPIPFVIPCHRVVRSDGHIGQYGAGGAQAKRAVLRSEGVDPDELERLASAGVRYFGSDTTRIYCFPTCRHARRTSERHLVRFRSAADAMAVGYRACKVCRPFAAAAAA
ncbi:MAG: methylated-DNA--[protein]-cysteine S-methyltransferase [Chloroflexi bacterium]|nr:methylated-DNA--[protein]-cysteine S-methyltransferase [Chloroflexota bacterium]